MAIFFKNKYFYLSLIFIIFLFLFVFSGFLFYSKPIIYDISPIPTSHKDIIIIKGNNLGYSTGEININNNYLVKSSIISWDNTEIVFKITDEVNSGLIFVKGERGTSNELFLVISRQVPVKLNRKNIPFIFSEDKIILNANSSTLLQGMNLFSPFSTITIFLETKDKLYTILPQNILDVSENRVEFVSPKTLNSSGKLYVLLGNIQSNKVSFSVKNDFFKWTLSDSKEFAIIEEIYFSQDVSSNFDSNPQDINFNIFYLRPIENERQKITERNSEHLDFNIDNLFFENLKTNKFIFKTRVKTYKLNLEFLDAKYLESIEVNRDINNQEYKKYVQDKKKDYLSYSYVDLMSLDSLILSKTSGSNSVYKLAKAIIDVLTSNFKIVENNLSLKDSIEEKKISSGNLIVLTNLLFLKYDIPLRNIVGLYYDSNSLKLKEHFWFEFFLAGVGFVYFDIINAVLFKDSSKYFLNISDNYIQYGCKEDYDKNEFFDGYLDSGFLKYKSLTNGSYSLMHKFVLEDNF
ncbi:DNA-binding protein [Borreliella burgdorferi]|uniref:IPT/TIG domain-containing protein n=1 Tax=Borreliella burgdorferi TaxID=139 RepID=UPI00017F4145|nr:IPT/TIG domain-containing protein [Borreliella burgdorferi]EEF56829.1 IPT/TIG domain protein [Borreliella burgdorferi 64b]MCD2411923.1 DNA-binding protein [Borreliella burgdorferi]WKC94621.1 DNA-binding protein [Borreliella burgdorferi]